MRKKRGSYTTTEEYFESAHGYPLSEDGTRMQKSFHIKKMREAGQKIVDAIVNLKKIYVFADYDCDGITSAAQMELLITTLFNMLHALPEDQLKESLAFENVHCNDTKAFYEACAPAFEMPHIPHRFSEGYGIKASSIDNINADILITIDNGIAGLEAVKKAKEKGMYVIVLDHHMAGTDRHGNAVYPDADILIDPEALPEESDFNGYCGAGLAYKLAEQMMPHNTALLDKMSAFAALGTIADCVPVKEDNRKIIKRGFSVLNSGGASNGLNGIIDEYKLNGRIDSEAIQFKLAPTINAPGRLKDDGGQNVLNLLSGDNVYASKIMSRQIIEANEFRKNLVNNALDQVQDLVRADDPINFIDFQGDGKRNISGILGLLAGKLTEQTGKPSFVFTTDNGLCHGSARSDDESTNNVHAILGRAAQYLTGYGGHPGAAGFAFREENKEQIHDLMVSGGIVPHDMTQYYDLDLDPCSAANVLETLDKMQPFGQGFEKPVFRIRVDFTQKNFWTGAKKKDDHDNIKFVLTGGMYALGFGLQPEFLKDHEPRHLYLYGNLVWNYFNGRRSPQFLIDGYDIRPNET